jgi:hypothetical protein
MVGRTPQRPNPALEALQDQRDHLRIQISLMADAPGGDARQLAKMQRELAGLEIRISNLQRRPENLSRP